MIITVASGKGGTGKTSVAVSMALSLAGDGQDPPLLLDCDVEEPNAALFLRPAFQECREVGHMIPEISTDACNFCGRCAEVCQYHAISVVGQQVLVFAELCHGCGSCTLNCPTGAIHEVLQAMGTIEHGWAGPIEFGQGTMNVGEAMAVPIIRGLKQAFIPADPGDRPIIVDASPGASCPVVESIHGSDFVLLVTEPTPFGLHDLQMAVEVARDEMGMPVGVLINRDGIGDQGVTDFCKAQNVPVLMRIPLDRRIAEAYSEGIPMTEALPEYRQKFQQLYANIEQLVTERKAA